MDGRLVSIDNGAAFTINDPSRPRYHLRRICRFSRSMIREIRLLDEGALLPILYPEPSRAERRRYKAFLERRQELLEHVDACVARHGESVVLFFD